LFNELIITENKLETTENAYWENNGSIIINSVSLMKSWSKRKDGSNGRERTIEEIVHSINKLFLIEFICMEIAGGIQKNVKCDKHSYLRCTPRMTAKEMLRNGKNRTCLNCNKELTHYEYKNGLCECEI